LALINYTTKSYDLPVEKVMKKMILATLFGCALITQAEAAATASQQNTENTNTINKTLPQAAPTENQPASASAGCGCTGDNANTETNKNLETHDVAKPPVQGS
jgi:hypothetical protein